MYCRLQLQELLRKDFNWLCCIRGTWLSSAASHLTLNTKPPLSPHHTSWLCVCFLPSYHVFTLPQPPFFILVFLLFDRLWKHSSENRGRENLLHSLCHIWHPSLWLFVGGHWRPAGNHLREKHLESWEDIQGELLVSQWGAFAYMWLQLFSFVNIFKNFFWL